MDSAEPRRRDRTPGRGSAASLARPVVSAINPAALSIGRYPSVPSSPHRCQPGKADVRQAFLPDSNRRPSARATRGPVLTPWIDNSAGQNSLLAGTRQCRPGPHRRLPGNADERATRRRASGESRCSSPWYRRQRPRLSSLPCGSCHGRARSPDCRTSPTMACHG